MAAISGIKTVGSDFKNLKQWVRVTYDFAADGGATGALNILTAASPVVVTDFIALVKTAVTSGGSATISVGITGTAGAIMSAVGKASFTANAVLPPPLVEGTPNTQALPLRLATSDVLIQNINTAALTAGKIEYIIGYVAG